MDATKLPASIGIALLLLALAGCEGMKFGPTARPTDNDTPQQPTDEPIVVQADENDAKAKPDDLQLTVAEFIEHIANASAAAERDDAPPSEPEPDDTIPDDPEPKTEQFATSQPADNTANESPNIVVTPEEPSAAGTESAPPATLPKPPVLAGVTVRGDDDAEVSQADPNAPPQVNVGAVAAHAPQTLADFLRNWPQPDDDAPFRRQLDRRVLAAIAGDYETARQPLEGVSNEQQALALRLVESLIVVREEAHGGAPAEAAERILAELDALRSTLQPLTDLRVPTVAVCSEVTGFGQYREIQPAVFPAGVVTDFVVYCEVRDFESQKTEDNQFRTVFDLRTRLINRAGDVILDLSDENIVDQCRQKRHDCFIPRLVRLPASLAPGEYVVKVTVSDKLGEKVAENRATIRIAAWP